MDADEWSSIFLACRSAFIQGTATLKTHDISPRQQSSTLTSGRGSDSASPAEPWGNETVKLDFPGGPYTLNGLSAIQAKDLDERFTHYCIPISDERNSVQIKVFKGPDNPQSQRILDSGEFTLDLEHFGSGTLVNGLQFSGSIDFLPDMRGYVSTPANEAGRTDSVFENYLRLMVAYRMLQQESLMLHSAAIVINDYAYVFYGISGAGKSTISEMAANAGFEVISDDLNAVFLTGNGASVRKLPFTGTFSESTCKKESYPLKAIFTLRKGISNETRPVGRTQSLASLIVCSPFVNANGFMLEALQDRLLQLLGRIPVGELVFTKDNGFDEISKLLENQID